MGIANTKSTGKGQFLNVHHSQRIPHMETNLDDAQNVEHGCSFMKSWVLQILLIQSLWGRSIFGHA